MFCWVLNTSLITASGFLYIHWQVTVATTLVLLEGRKNVCREGNAIWEISSLTGFKIRPCLMMFNKITKNIYKFRKILNGRFVDGTQWWIIKLTSDHCPLSINIRKPEVGNIGWSEFKKPANKLKIVSFKSGIFSGIHRSVICWT